jgi:mannose/fructose/N-acetylgalactosamine-specific phosphotransferase system component IID
MYLVAIAWIYVALMMAVAEATHSSGTLLGAIVTFVLYGLVPVSIVMYLLGAPSRNKARKARERAEWVAQQNAMAVAGTAVEGVSALTAGSVSQPDASGHATSAAQATSVAPVREKP